MFKIDALAHNSALKKIPASEKMFFTIFLIMLAISVKKLSVAAIILAVNAAITIYKGKIPVKVYLKLLSLPLGFLLAGIIPLVIRFHNWVPALDATGVQPAQLIAASSLASLSAMYFLALTTPFAEIAVVFNKLRMPKILIELMLLIYRFIFVLMETAVQMATAQSARLGYSGVKNGYRSLALLSGNLFFAAYRRANEVFTAMLARNYEGEIKLLFEDKKFSLTRGLSICGYFTALLILAFVR